MCVIPLPSGGEDDLRTPFGSRKLLDHFDELPPHASAPRG
jgi:hypothetical protein